MPSSPHGRIAHERFIGNGATRLYVRDIGEGMPLIVVHGGPDFDHEYLLPDMDRLGDCFHVVYYDQRGRGRSFSGQDPDSITLAGEIDDLDRVRRELGFDRIAVLGHSWGGVLAMEYAIRHTNRVASLILVNTAPASHADAAFVRDEILRRRSTADRARLAALASDPHYVAGDPAADVELYRVHFGLAVRDPEKLDLVLARLRAAFDRHAVLAARAIEHCLLAQTWDRDDYDLLPALRRLDIPTLVVHGDADLIPVAIAERVADAVPGAQLAVLADCGHFAYFEQPEAFCRTVAAFASPAT